MGEGGGPGERERSDDKLDDVKQEQQNRLSVRLSVGQACESRTVVSQ